MEQIILRFWNERLQIGMRDWRTVYLFRKDEAIQLNPEIYKGNLVYRLPGSSKRFSYKDFKSGVVKKKIPVDLRLPF